MKIIITGGTGFIGTALCNLISREAHELVLFSRSIHPKKKLQQAVVRYVQWNAGEEGEWQNEIEGASVVINLAGKNLFEHRWNKKIKKEIWNSRILATKKLVEAVQSARHKPELLISASAVGVYGNRGSELLNEQSSTGNDFLANLVAAWEKEAFNAEQAGVRVATPRIGLVLEKSGGIIERMLLPFKLCAGGPIGSGEQILSWIHMADVVRGIIFPIENKNFSGVYNLTAPNAVTMKEFSKIFGKILHRPSRLPVPKAALKILFGEAAEAIVSSQHAVPEKLLHAGFSFSFPEITSALENILNPQS
ncbi:MAG: TIGR01777 family protein [Bacteroidetes bacterium]|nr:TIGR01777 family protein [Bacteroidota bacterium]